MEDQPPGDAATLASGISGDAWLSLATSLADVGRWVYDRDAGVCFVDDVLLGLTGLSDPQPMDVARFVSHIHVEDQPGVERSLETAFGGGQVFETNFRFERPDGRTIWLKGKGRPVTLPDDRTVLIGVNYDTTDLQNAITSNRLLANEMAHRVKNLISLVSGMFRMAQRTTSDPAELGAAYLGRLEALTALNDLIFDSEQRCVSIDSLFAKVFAPLTTDARVTVDAADFRLNATSAQTLVLAINELMTNAVKYGALAEGSGRIRISVVVDATADTFDLAWHETLAREIAPPATNGGFGMNVLTRMTKHTFDGNPKITWRPDGLSFTCRWKASEMSGASGSADREKRLFEEAARATAAVQHID